MNASDLGDFLCARRAGIVPESIGIVTRNTSRRCRDCDGTRWPGSRE